MVLEKKCRLDVDPPRATNENDANYQEENDASSSDESGHETSETVNDDTNTSSDTSTASSGHDQKSRHQTNNASQREAIQTENTQGQENQRENAQSVESARKARIRDMLIFKEINNDRLPTQLPATCDMIFPDPNELHMFKIRISPAEGFWRGGIFFFDVLVPDGYNFEPPKVKCTTKIWHPNISEDGAVCLSILRSGAIDETCWNPARQLKDVILGINSLFTDLVNFHDPLNNEAAAMYKRDPINFQARVNTYIREYATATTPQN